MKERSVRTYVLVGQTPVPEPDPLKWAVWLATVDRVVFQTEVGASMVSTVFLGIDHNFFNDGPPILFETLIFTDGDGGGECYRCATWLEAEQQHKRIVTDLRTRLRASQSLLN